MTIPLYRPYSNKSEAYILQQRKSDNRRYDDIFKIEELPEYLTADLSNYFRPGYFFYEALTALGIRCLNDLRLYTKNDIKFATYQEAGKKKNQRIFTADQFEKIDAKVKTYFGFFHEEQTNVKDIEGRIAKGRASFKPRIWPELTVKPEIDKVTTKKLIKLAKQNGTQITLTEPEETEEATKRKYTKQSKKAALIIEKDEICYEGIKILTPQILLIRNEKIMKYDQDLEHKGYKIPAHFRQKLNRFEKLDPVIVAALMNNNINTLDDIRRFNPDELIECTLDGNPNGKKHLTRTHIKALEDFVVENNAWFFQDHQDEQTMITRIDASTTGTKPQTYNFN